ncbi:NnrU family protein [Celeribacter persicus]|jgi:Predicted membrane protein|uniref:Putative membrane protein n=1 Tax=Celeribacter persicus TaxID=1651082 RepID=A0A2T5HCN9_9RHOB|nr:NnrU family protein [Celeribacter persicus]PTQ69337.1 putative membrane protein [Celeribacter persicus]
MHGWGGFIIACFVFFLSHALPVRPPVKPWLVARFGARGFAWGYSALSVAVLAWLIVAAGRAPVVLLWSGPDWLRHVTLTVMFAVCVILAFTLGRPNPFSFGGTHNERFDPSQPGIVRLTRHPVLLALTLWAGAHLLVNGDLAHAILFGAFAGFALLGGGMITRRKRREMGADYERLWGATRAVPLRLSPTVGTGLRLGVAVILYGVLIALHGPVIGISPLP